MYQKMSKLAVQGGVVWITGLSNAGKTTVARALVTLLRSRGGHPIHLDGDDLRAVFNIQRAYAPGDREALALTYSRLAAHLAQQGHVVVVSTISLVSAVHRQNRQTMNPYLDVVLRADDTVRHARDVRGVLRGTDIVGDDQAAAFPDHPGLEFDNDGKRTPQELATKVLDKMEEIGINVY